MLYCVLDFWQTVTKAKNLTFLLSRLDKSLEGAWKDFSTTNDSLYVSVSRVIVSLKIWIQVFFFSQFVPFRDYIDRTGNHILSMARLAKDVLAEIPDQFLSYMRTRGIKPSPAPPPYTPPGQPLQTQIWGVQMWKTWTWELNSTYRILSFP